jgi:hypothetical protein
MKQSYTHPGSIFYPVILAATLFTRWVINRVNFWRAALRAPKTHFLVPPRRA